MGTTSPISKDWRSPFVGKSIEDAANFVRNTPQPPKPLCRRFFVVLQKEFYEKCGRILICRISPGDIEDEIEGDWNKEDGLKQFKEAGRSLVCKAILGEQRRAVADGGVPAVTSAMRNIGVHDEGAESLENDEDEFRADMVGYHAAHVGLFFSATERYWWWS